MAITDIINTTGALFQEFPELLVWVGNSSGDPPDEPGGSPATLTDAHCVRVVQSAGGQRLDFSVLSYLLTGHLVNRSQPAEFSRMVDVRFPDDPTYTRIARGDIVIERAHIDPDTETLVTESHIRGYHYGEPVTGYDVHDPFVPYSTGQLISDDILFNPTIDNETVFNRSSQKRAGGNGYLWSHPDMADAATAQTYHGFTPQEWTLTEAIETLCELLNGGEEFILNPSSYTVIATPPDVRNIRIKLGTRLPEALDTLLLPHGFNWFIEYDKADEPQITLFKIGDGDIKNLYLQMPPASLVPASSNVGTITMDNGIGDSFNVVEAIGEREEAEMTLPLYAGWDASKDALTDLDKDGVDYTGNEDVWRLFIANEGADIDPAVSRLGVTPDVPDLSTVFTVAVSHRRPMGEPLTYRNNPVAGQRPQRGDIVIEWSDDGGTTWKPEEPSWTIKLAPDQVGILFDGFNIPQELRDAGDDMRLRITGTVFGDYRVTGLATKSAHAANGRSNRQVLSVPDKFQHRFKVGAGPYKSVLTNPADERDDSTPIQEFAEAIRDQNHYAEVDTNVRLPGWHHEYKISDRIRKVEGRELLLDAAPPSSPDVRYPQVVERHFEMDADGPVTILVLDRGVDTT